MTDQDAAGGRVAFIIQDPNEVQAIGKKIRVDSFGVNSGIHESIGQDGDQISFQIENFDSDRTVFPELRLPRRRYLGVSSGMRSLNREIVDGARSLGASRSMRRT